VNSPGADLKLRAATVFVDVGFKRGEKPDTFVSTATFRRDNLTKKDTLRVTLPKAIPALS